MKTSDMKTSDMKSSDMKSNDMKTNDMKTNELETPDTSKPAMNTNGFNPTDLKTQDFYTCIEVDVTPVTAFNNINAVSKWWTENIEGGSQALGDEFIVRFGDVHYSRHRIVDFLPGQKVAWLVTDSKLNFLQDKQEWNNTKIVFEITDDNGKTRIRFSHLGLVPDIECYSACSNAWSQYIQQSLFSLLKDGKGKPDKKVQQPVTGSEK